MDGSWRQMSSWEFFTLLVNITWVPLVSSFFVFFHVWRVDRVMHDGGIFRGQFFGNETAVRSVVSFLMLQKADSLISDVRDGWLKKKKFWLHTHFHPPLLKKEHQISWKCILLWHLFVFLIYFYLSAWAQISAANGLGDQIHHAFAICSGSWFKATHFFFLFYFYLLLKLLCMVLNVLHSSLSLCVGVQN